MSHLPFTLMYRLNKTESAVFIFWMLFSSSDNFLNQILLFIGHVPFIHSMLFLLSKIVLCGVQKHKGRLITRKIGIKHVLHI